MFLIFLIFILTLFNHALQWTMHRPSTIEQRNGESPQPISTVASREVKELYEVLCEAQYKIDIKILRNVILLHTILAGVDFDVGNACSIIVDCK